MDRRLIELHVENFRSLRKVTIPLGPVNVLVGPNGAGKTNVLEVFRFLADVARTDLVPALDLRGGCPEILFRKAEKPPASFVINLKATLTPNSHAAAPDVYSLRVKGRQGQQISREEKFEFTRTRGHERQIVIIRRKATVFELHETTGVYAIRPIGIGSLSSGLSTLPRLSGDDGPGDEVATMADQLRSCRGFDISADAARLPSRLPVRAVALDDDAGNLAAFLHGLRANEHAWQCLIDDARQVLPHLEGIEFEYPGGASHNVAVVLHERGLRHPVQLGDASDGTVRLLGLLAMLYDPNPPALTCVEGIDIGIHPQALELLVERLREASERTQFLITTHSRALADRLHPDELILCERRDDGSSAIPASSIDKIGSTVFRSEGAPLGNML